MLTPYSKAFIGIRLDGFVSSNASPDVGPPSQTNVVVDLPGRTDQGFYYPEWRELAKQGYNVTTDRTASKYSAKQSYGTLRNEFLGLSGPSTGKTQWSSCSGALAGNMAAGNGFLPLPTYVPVAKSVINDALNSFYSDVQEAISPANVGLMLAEARETGKMLRSKSKQFIDVATGFLNRLIQDPRLRTPVGRYVGKGPRRRKVTRKSKLKHVANEYLEFTYGVQPLAADIDALKQALSSIDIPPFTHVRAGKRRKDSSTPLALTQRALPGWMNQCSIEINDTVTQKAAFYGRVKHEQFGLPAIGQRLGFTLSNFVPTLVEVIPYSFLADYFSNISEWIASKTGLRSYIHWASLSTVQEYTRRLDLGPALYNPRYIPSSPLSEYWVSTGKAYVEIKRKTISRDANPDLDLSLRFEVPSLSSRKWLNMAMLALSHSRLKTILYY